MGENSKIEWCDHTFNPWIGCTKVSPGCQNCYAEVEDNRRRWTPNGWGKGKKRKLTSYSNWNLPLKWDKQARIENKRKKVFCASLADVFDSEVSDTWRDRLFEMIDKTPDLDWLLLTKRPEMALRYVEKRTRELAEKFLPDNVWLGLSVCMQKEADKNIPILLQIPAQYHFLSMEPLLEEIHLNQITIDNGDSAIFINALTGESWMKDGFEKDLPSVKSIDWVIVGGESGHNARPMHPNWVRSLRDHCEYAKTPFFFKQWGEWGYSDKSYGDQFLKSTIESYGIKIKDNMMITNDVGNNLTKKTIFMYGENDTIPPEVFERIGKKKSGRLLNGKEYNEFPKEYKK